WVITEPTREPRPRAAKATASSVSEYVMIEVTGPKASMSWTASAHGSSAWSTVAATYAPPCSAASRSDRSEEHTSELQSRFDLACRHLLEKKNSKAYTRG